MKKFVGRRTETAIVSKKEWDSIHKAPTKKRLKELEKFCKETNKMFTYITPEEALKRLRKKK